MTLKNLLLFFLFSQTIGFSQPLFINYQESKLAGKYMSFYLDSSRTADIQDITSLDTSVFFKTNTDFPSFGSSDMAVWVRIDIRSLSNEKCYFKFNNPRFDTVILYSSQNSIHFEADSSGYALPFQKRKFKVPSFIFELPLSSDTSKIHTYFLRVTSKKALHLSGHIGTIGPIMNMVFLNTVIDILYFGIILGMVLYNTFIFLSTRSKAYLIYIMFIFSMGSYIFFLKGYTIYLTDPIKFLFYQYDTALVSIVAGFALLFSMTFLNLKKVSKFIYYIMFSLVVINLVVLFIEQNNLAGLSARLQNIFLLISSFVLIIVAIYATYKKVPGAKYYLISWFILISATVLYILPFLNIIPDNSYNLHLVPLGSALETILLSLALADRINTLKKDKEAVLQKSLTDADIYNEELSQREEELASNEEELRVANDALSEANIHLEALLLAEKNLNEQLTKNEDEIRKQTEELIESNKKTSEYKLMALRSVMNPHFLFNSLNSIQYFIINNDREPALNYLSTFSKLIRAILDSSIQSSNVLSNEIDLLKLYISLETLRFDQKFRTIFKIDENIEIENIEVPTLILQPYVENAILHGLYNKLETTEGELTIEFKNNDNNLICIVEDNGVGREEARKIREASRLHKSIGMMVTQERLDLINKNNNLSIKITDLKDSNGSPMGTRVEVTILKY